MRKLIVIAMLALGVMACTEDNDVTPFNGLEPISSEALSGRTFTQVEHYIVDNGVETPIEGNIGRTVNFLMENDGVNGTEISQGGMLGTVDRPFRIVEFISVMPRLDYNMSSNPNIGNTTSAYFEDGQLKLVTWSSVGAVYSVFE